MNNDAPRFKGAPFNLRTIRWHRTRRGWEWQYWNYRVNRWCRYTAQAITVDEARRRTAQSVYGCDVESVTVEAA